MTAEEWAQCDEPLKMLIHLGEGANERSVRLFACACCRRIWDLLPGDLARQAVLAVEEFPALQGQPGSVFDHAILSAAIIAASSVESEHSGNDAYWAVKCLGRSYYKLTPLLCVLEVSRRAIARAKEREEAEPEAAAQARLLRCVFGDPFSPRPPQQALRTPTVVSLARAAYEERQLPSGDLEPDRLAVLADALEDAGAADNVVSHLRSPGPHVRGCHVIDLILGLE